MDSNHQDPAVGSFDGGLARPLRGGFGSVFGGFLGSVQSDRVHDPDRIFGRTGRSGWSDRIFGRRGWRGWRGWSSDRIFGRRGWSGFHSGLLLPPSRRQQLDRLLLGPLHPGGIDLPTQPVRILAPAIAAHG